MLAILANCEVCEDTNGKKTSCDVARLELGDRVGVEFTTMGRKNKKPAKTKYGKSRTFVGQARAISILASYQNHDDQAKDDDSSSQKGDSSSKKTNQDDKNKDKDSD